MRRSLGAAASALVLVAACTPSKVDPAADVRISGGVTRQDGSPVVAARVALSREPDAGELLAIFTTLGLACLDDEADIDACDDARITTAGPDGRFTYRIRGRDTQGSVGNASVLALATRAGPRAGQLDGPATTVRFMVQTERVSIRLPLWEPRVRVAVEGRRGTVRWDAVPPRARPAPTGEIEQRVAFATSAGDVVWEIEGDGSAVFDPRVLEDARGTTGVVGEASSIDVSEAAGTRVAFTIRSPLLPFAGRAGAPVSRAAGCSVETEAGDTIPHAPCALTDGRFGETFSPDLCTEDPCRAVARAAVVDLGASRRIDLLVVRGCATRCVVETGTPGRWVTAGIGAAESFALAPRAGTRARYVRVVGSVASLREVSVWDRFPVIEGPPRSLIRPPAPGEAEEPPGAPSRAPIVVIVAALLLSLAAGGVGWFFGRRARRAAAAG